MPIRNTVKEYDAPAYYHVYNRGAGGAPIFLDDHDRAKFLSLFARHLDSRDMTRDANREVYRKYTLEIIAYCLTDNHFHLLLYQQDDPTAITQLMRSVATAYTMYFNRKYKRAGHLFQSAFKAARITEEPYLAHITRYIHMNPRSYLRYKWSSIAYYLGVDDAPVWLRPDRLNAMHPRAYRQFLREYDGKKAELKRIKNQLAN